MQKVKFYSGLVGICVLSAAAGLTFGYFVIGPIGVSAQERAYYAGYPEPAVPAYNYDFPDPYDDALPIADDDAPVHNFLVTSRDGLIIVYHADESHVKEITSIPVNALPEAEQARLAEGIRIYTEEALFRILEDYGS